MWFSKCLCTTNLPQRAAETHFVTTGEQQHHGREQRGNGACAPLEIIRVPVSISSLSYYDSNDKFLSMFLMYSILGKQ